MAKAAAKKAAAGAYVDVTSIFRGRSTYFGRISLASAMSRLYEDENNDDAHHCILTTLLSFRFVLFLFTILYNHHHHIHTSAQAQAASFYRPLLLLTNGLYLVLRFFVVPDAADTNGVAAFLRQDWPLVGVAGAQWYAYHGILDRASQQQHRRKSETTSLVGGSHLDLLFVAVAVQYGALLWSRRVYGVLLLLPVWAAYGVYTTFLGGGSKGKPAAAAPNIDSNFAEDEDTAHKRQKRAEKRRQKWS